MGGSPWRGLPLTPLPRPRPQFDPELVLVSAGFDSAIGDPEVRAWPGWEGFRGPAARPVTPALAAGADAGHARVLRPPHAAAAGARRRPGLRHAGGDCGKQGGPAGQRLRCSRRSLLPNDTPAPFMSLPSSLLPPPSLQGGYHLESLSLSVCMMVQALLGDPAPPLSGPMVPHRRCEAQEGGKGQARPGLTTSASPHSALESIQSVRAAQAPHWTSLQQQGRRGLGRVVGSHLGLLGSGCDSEPPFRPDACPESQHALPRGEAHDAAAWGA